MAHSSTSFFPNLLLWVQIGSRCRKLNQLQARIFRPLELVAVSLAGCTAMDVISILRKKQQAVTGFEVQVQARQTESHPRVFEHAKIVYLVSGHNVDETAVLRAIELSALKYCPAQAMLSKVFPMDLLYEIYEEKGSGE